MTKTDVCHYCKAEEWAFNTFLLSDGSIMCMMCAKKEVPSQAEWAVQQ